MKIRHRTAFFALVMFGLIIPSSVALHEAVHWFQLGTDPRVEPAGFLLPLNRTSLAAVNWTWTTNDSQEQHAFIASIPDLENQALAVQFSYVGLAFAILLYKRLI